MCRKSTLNSFSLNFYIIENNRMKLKTLSMKMTHTLIKLQTLKKLIINS